MHISIYLIIDLIYMWPNVLQVIYNIYDWFNELINNQKLFQSKVLQYSVGQPIVKVIPTNITCSINNTYQFLV